RFPRHLPGGHAGRNRLAADRSLPPTADDCGSDWQHHQFSRRVVQLLSGRCNRRDYRGGTNPAVSAGLCLCACAWPSGKPTPCAPGTGGRNMITLLLEPFSFTFMNNALVIALLVA